MARSVSNPNLPKKISNKKIKENLETAVEMANLGAGEEVIFEPGSTAHITTEAQKRKAVKELNKMHKEFKELGEA